MRVTFQTPLNATKLNAKLSFWASNKWWNYDLSDQSKVCEYLSNGKCPLDAGSAATYSFVVHVGKLGPFGRKSEVELKITNENHKIITCGRIHVYVRGWLTTTDYKNTIFTKDEIFV